MRAAFWQRATKAQSKKMDTGSKDYRYDPEGGRWPRKENKSQKCGTLKLGHQLFRLGI